MAVYYMTVQYVSGPYSQVYMHVLYSHFSILRGKSYY